MVDTRKEIPLFRLADKIQKNGDFPGQGKSRFHQFSAIPGFQLEFHFIQGPLNLACDNAAGVYRHFNQGVSILQPKNLALEVGFEDNLQPIQIQPASQRCFLKQ